MSDGPRFDDRPEITIQQGERLSSNHKAGIQPGWFYLAVSKIFGAATIVLALYMGYLMLNPQTPLNPLPPPTPLPTPTLFILPVQAVVMDTAVVPTMPQIATPLPEATQTPLPEDSLQVTLAPNEKPFILLGESVQYAANDSAEACDGIWIAGRVFDLNGAPIAGIPILITGEGFQEIQVSGTYTDFGDSGYRVRVANNPVRQPFSVTLLDPTTAQAISDDIAFDTRETCDSNLIIVDFIQALAYSFPGES